MYKKLHKNFAMPLTFKFDSLQEAKEIIKNYPEKKFIVKPIIGTGGIGIKFFNENLQIYEPLLLQEFIEGDNVSSSFLSYKNHKIEHLFYSSFLKNLINLLDHDYNLEYFLVVVDFELFQCMHKHL